MPRTTYMADGFHRDMRLRLLLAVLAMLGFAGLFVHLLIDCYEECYSICSSGSENVKCIASPFYCKMEERFPGGFHEVTCATGIIVLLAALFAGASVYVAVKATSIIDITDEDIVACKGLIPRCKRASDAATRPVVIVTYSGRGDVLKAVLAGEAADSPVLAAYMAQPLLKIVLNGETYTLRLAPAEARMIEEFLEEHWRDRAEVIIHLPP